MRKFLSLCSLLIAMSLLPGCGPQPSESPESPETAPATNVVEPDTATNAAAPSPDRASTPPPVPGKTKAPTATNATAAAEQEKPEEVAVIKTNLGEMVVAFWPEVAPKTVANFKKLAEDGFYNGTAFHRVIKGFMIQGGDPLTKDPAQEPNWGKGDPGYKINAEFNDRPHVRGVISMARARDPNSAGSQFFICLDRAPNLDNQYTTFGKLIEGEDVLMKIGDVEVKPSPDGEASRPVSRVHVESIQIVPRSSIEKVNKE